MNKNTNHLSKETILNKSDPTDVFPEENLPDESLADCLEFLIRTTPTTMPEWMN